MREYLCDIIEDNTEEKCFGCTNCDIDESHIVFKDDNNTLFLNDIIKFITKYVLSPYNLAHNEIGDCCGCFTIIDNQGIIRCNECNKTIHEAYHAQFEGDKLREEELRKDRDTDHAITGN